MGIKDIEKSVMSILGEIDTVDIEKLCLQDTINLVLDSLEFVRFLVNVEQKFEISIDEDDLNYERFKTFNDVCQYVYGRLMQKDE